MHAQQVLRMGETFLLLPPRVDAPLMSVLFAEGPFPKSGWEGGRAACGEARRVTASAQPGGAHEQLCSSSFVGFAFFPRSFISYFYLAVEPKCHRKARFQGISPATFLASRGRRVPAVGSGPSCPWGCALPGVSSPAGSIPVRSPRLKPAAALCVRVSWQYKRGHVAGALHRHRPGVASSITASALTRNHFRRN